MDYRDALQIAANWSAVGTVAVALGAGGYVWYERARKRRKLENYLKGQKEQGTDKGQRSIVHLMRHLAMTEADILQAAFTSKKIQPRTSEVDGIAKELLLEHK